MTLSLDPALIVPDPVPDAAPDFSATEPPKRRGRPPGSKNRTTTEREAAGGTASTPRATRTRTVWREAEQVERHLTDLVLLASTAVAFADSFDGQHLAAAGPDVVHQLVELAKEEKHLRKYLELSATPGKYGPLTLSIIALALPIVVHHNLIPIPGMAARFVDSEGGV